MLYEKALRNVLISIHRHMGISICIVTGIILLWFYYTHRVVSDIFPKHIHLAPYVQKTTLVWWNWMPAQYHDTVFCGVDKCTFSSDRNLLPDATGVLFYGSDIHGGDVPIPRINKYWALLHEESPRNVPFIRYTTVLKHFNFTSTFSRHSNLPLTTQYLPSLEDLTSIKYVVSVEAKSIMRREGSIAPIAFIHSDCDSMSGREDYVRELMQYISVDSYGSCLNTRDLPQALKENYLNNLYSPEFLRFLARYKFIIAYENGICDDYITEKLWRPLIIGSIPIYYGSPTVRDFAPNPKSIIYISDFSSPQQLAKFIKKLDANDIEYNTYLSHKYNLAEPISNQYLLAVLHFRGYSYGHGSLSRAFECAVCKKVSRLTHGAKQEETTDKVYNCPMPPPLPKMSVPQIWTKDWANIMAIGKCQATILNKLWHRDQEYSRADFDLRLQLLIDSGSCSV